MGGFASSLKRARIASRDPAHGGLLTQERLAELIGEQLGTAGALAPTTVSNWERGRARPRSQDRATLWAIVGALACCGGIASVRDADALLIAGGYAPLSEEEAAHLRTLVVRFRPRDDMEASLRNPAPVVQASAQAPDAPSPSVVIVIRHQSMEPIPPYAVRGALPLKQHDGEIVEVVVNQTDLFHHRRLIDPLAAARRQADLESRLAGLLEAHADASIAYYGIAHIPLVFLAGYQLSNRRRTALYDFDRASGTWDLLGRGGVAPPLRVTGLPERVIVDAGAVVVRMSVSYRVRREVVAEVIGAPIGEIDLALEHPTIDAIASEAHVWACAGVFRGAMDAVHERFPNATGVHIFYAGPPPLAFACGQRVSKTIHRRLVIYNYLASDAPSYSWGLDLTRGVDEPGFLVRPMAV